MRLGVAAVALGAAALVGAGLVLSRFIDPDRREVRSTLVAPERPVVMRTKGGLLEVSTVQIGRAHV